VLSFSQYLALPISLECLLSRIRIVISLATNRIQSYVLWLARHYFRVLWIWSMPWWWLCWCCDWRWYIRGCIQETESNLEAERSSSQEAHETSTVLERKLIAVQTELDDLRSLLEAVSIARLWWVLWWCTCLSVCLSVSLSLCTHTSKLKSEFHHFYARCLRSVSVLLWRRCNKLYNSSFVWGFKRF